MSEAHGNSALGPTAIEPREHLKLLDLVAAPAEHGVQIRQFFAGWNQPG